MSHGVVHPTQWFAHVLGAYHELQTQESRSLPPWAYKAFYPLKIAIRAFEEFQHNHGVTRASALAFTTLLALVPLSVVVFQLFSRLIFFAETQQEVETWLFSYVLPAKSEEVKQFLLDTVGQRSTSLRPVAIAMLIITCLLLLNTIEKTFNTIWAVRRPRPLGRRVVAYWAVLTMPALLVTLSFVAYGKIDSWLEASVGQVPLLYAIILRLLSMTPTWLAFTCGYLFVPYTHVRPRAAFLGAVAAGTIWELGKDLFFWYSRTMFTNIETLYGPLSTVPVTLIWVYVSWVIVIFGAEIAFAVQFPESVTAKRGAAEAQRLFRDYYAVRIMSAIVRHYLHGDVEDATAPRLATELETPPAVMLPLLDELREAGLILLTDDEAWVPARPPNTITVQHVIAATGDQQFCVPDGARDPVSDALRTHFGEVRDTMREHFVSMTLTELADTVR